MQNIGARIKELRKKNGLTQERLADHLGVTDKAVSKWECGLTLPDLALIIPLAKIFNISADELLSGSQSETDARRVTFDERCDNDMKYDAKENYHLALQAVSEYPKEYKYLLWLASTEYSLAFRDEYKEEPAAQYSTEMLERAIKHNNIVIEECRDNKIRYNAIWDAMMCFKCMNRYDEAFKYAEMLPYTNTLTRDSALEECLQGEELITHKKWRVHNTVLRLCLELSRIYWFAESDEPYVKAALDTEEAILKAVFPNGDYLNFHEHLCCAYQKRAEFEIQHGNYDKAIEHIQTMMNHAKMLPAGNKHHTGGLFDGLSMHFSEDGGLPYVYDGLDDINKPISEQLKNRIITLEVFSPLWKREDFKNLVK